MRFRGLIVIAVLAGALAVTPAYGRVADHNPARTIDPAGDSNGAPDITGVTVANDLSGVLLFVVQVGNREGVVANDLVTLLFDSDANPATGAQGGVDHIIRIDGTTQRVFMVRWNGTTFEPVATTTLLGAWQSGYVVAINRSELGNTSAFDFLVVTGLANATEAQDLAPDREDGHYSISAPHVASITPRFAPAAPRAGATFRLNSVTSKFETEESATAGTFTCRATLAGKRLRGTGRGGCTFKLPKTAKGKQLVLTVSVTPTGGKAQTFPAYKFRVR